MRTKLLPPVLSRKRSKYGATRQRVGKHILGSKKEHIRYLTLKEELRRGEIRKLEIHPRYLLQVPFTDITGKRHREITYEADFQYIRNGVKIVEDVKGFKTPMYRLKIKMFLFIHCSSKKSKLVFVET